MQESQEPKPVDTQSAEAGPAPGMSRRQIAGLVLVSIVVLALIIALLYGLVSHPVFTSIVRDIAIIVLAFVTVVVCLFLIILIYQLQSLMALLRYEIKPILESANDTASTVRGTTTFVSDAVVTPMIRVASYAAGVRQAMASASMLRSGKGQPGGSPPEPPQNS